MCLPSKHLELGYIPPALGFWLEEPGMASRKRKVNSLACMAGLQREVETGGFSTLDLAALDS